MSSCEGFKGRALIIVEGLAHGGDERGEAAASTGVHVELQTSSGRLSILRRPP
jgi:hypothetical protein